MAAMRVPIAPTTLSRRTSEQLLDFFRDFDLPAKRIHASLPMVQGIKALHGEAMAPLRSGQRRVRWASARGRHLPAGLDPL